jgi:N,N'-diacetyllegionaminate synthase
MKKLQMIFIAEIGLNHNGNFGLTYELVRQAAWAGADIAKFQLGWRAGEGEINAITPEILGHILRCCDNFSIEPMFSIFNQSAWHLIKNKPFLRYKIASRTVREQPDLVLQIIAKGKDTFISCGMWDGDSLPFGEHDNVFYLWCKSSYPAHPWDLTELPKDFDNSPYAGYSDHSIGLDIPLMAITRGARIIEKHFTLDKSDVTIRDHALSATPDEFSQMVRIGRQIRRNLDLGV